MRFKCRCHRQTNRIQDIILFALQFLRQLVCIVYLFIFDKFRKYLLSLPDSDEITFPGLLDLSIQSGKTQLRMALAYNVLILFVYCKEFIQFSDLRNDRKGLL